jgi:quinol-cytochrome oxidoreductase complex cytochrome b subunit
MKKIKQIIISLSLVIGVGALVAPATAGAVNVYQPCTGVSDSAVCASKADSADTLIKTTVNTLLFVVGVASVIVIIIGGIMYTTSAGDASSVTKAKNTILYAIIGLVVAFLAFAIVNWVVGVFSPSAAQQQCDQKKGVYNATTKTCSK